MWQLDYLSIRVILIGTRIPISSERIKQIGTDFLVCLAKTDWQEFMSGGLVALIN